MVRTTAELVHGPCREVRGESKGSSVAFRVDRPGEHQGKG